MVDTRVPDKRYPVPGITTGLTVPDTAVTSGYQVTPVAEPAPRDIPEPRYPYPRYHAFLGAHFKYEFATNAKHTRSIQQKHNNG